MRAGGPDRTSYRLLLRARNCQRQYVEPDRCSRRDRRQGEPHASCPPAPYRSTNARRPLSVPRGRFHFVSRGDAAGAGSAPWRQARGHRDRETQV